MKKLILSLILIMTMLTSGCSQVRMALVNKMAEHAEKKLGFEVKDLCFDGEGSINIHNSEEETYIRLCINDGGLYTIMDRFKEAGIEPLDTIDTTSGFGGHSIVKQMRKENIVAQYYATETVKGSYIPKEINVFLTENPEGYEFMYIFIIG